MATKHEQLLQYIKELEVGEKISVRKMARTLGVSEGTAYRAIKEAELEGFVSTIERIGTVRIEKTNKAKVERLTYAEVVNIVEGTVLAGKEGLHKALQRFVIGAMALEALKKYLGPDRLMIVGNREEVHRHALLQGTAVLITGGFEASEEIKELSDQLELPVISSRYDSFTVATMINRAIFDRLIKKEILMVEDIIDDQKEPVFLRLEETVSDYEELVRSTRHSRYPVLDPQERVVGMLTSKDVMGASSTERVSRLMSKQPISVTKKTSIATAAHEMVWQGIELLPVVDDSKKLIGVVSRQDVIEALQSMQKQPQVGETIQELSVRGFGMEQDKFGNPVYAGKVTPQMTDNRGVLSMGVMTSLLTEAALLSLRDRGREDLTVQNIMLYPLKPVQIDSEIQIYCRLLELGRSMTKMDLEIRKEGQVVVKALLTAQVMEP